MAAPAVQRWRFPAARERDLKLRSLAGFTLDPDVAPPSTRRSPGRSTGPARSRHSCCWRRRVRSGGRCDRDPGVRCRCPDRGRRCGWSRCRPGPRRGPGAHPPIFAGVGEQVVGDHLIQTHPVPVAVHRVAGVHPDGAAGVGELLGVPVDDLLHQRRQVEPLVVEHDLPGRDPGDVQQNCRSVETTRPPESNALDIRSVTQETGTSPVVRSTCAPALQLQLQRGQRGPQLVRGDREELVARPDRCLGLLVQTGQLGLGPLQLGHVRKNQTRP